jgi:cation/acetate symporter
VRDARKSVAWSLFFIFLLYFTAPAYAAFAKLEVYTNVIGQSLDALPAWISTYSRWDWSTSMACRSRSSAPASAH